MRHFARIAGDAAFRAAVGQAGERAFPAHPHGQRRDFAQSDIRMITQAAFGRAERQMMLHAIAGENFHVAIIAMNRQRHGHGAFWKFQSIPFIRHNSKVIGDEIELPASHVERRMLVNLHGLKTNGSGAGGEGGKGFPCLRAQRRRKRLSA